MLEGIIILGIAPCLEEDLEKVLCKEKYDFLAVGLDCSDRVLFEIQHAATYHTEEFVEFHKRRKKAGGNLDYMTHSHTSVPKFAPDKLWPLVERHPFSGSSSYLGAQASVGMGYEKIILCGCPMSGQNILSPKKSAYDVFQKGWEKYAYLLQGKVRSMSGWTSEFLGYPPEDWIGN